MAEEKLGTIIEEALWNEDNDTQNVTAISTFEDAGLMTYDKGLVITMADGSEFQVTITQTKMEA